MAIKTALQPYCLPGKRKSFVAKTVAIGTAIHILSTGSISPNHATDSGNNLLIADTLEVKGSLYSGGSANYIKQVDGDMSFAGAAGFYPRVLEQDGEPAAGTGLTQIDSGETIIWIDTNDSDKSYLMYNYGGAVTKIELV